MTESRPARWRVTYDQLEGAVSPHLTDLVASATLRHEVVRLRRLQRAALRRLGGITQRGWHLLNLPAGSDVARLAQQIGALDAEVRRLQLRLAAAASERDAR